MMSDRSSATFTKAVKKHTVRAKEKLLESLGKADRTTDEKFEEHCNNFSKQQQDAERLQRELKKYATCAKALSDASKDLNEAIRNVYEADWPNSEHVRAMSESIELMYNDYNDKLNQDALNPLNSHCSQFPDIRNKINKRGRKLVDYDSARHYYEDLQSKKKDDSKLLKAQENLQETKKLYEEINDELLDELPTLYDSRITFYAANLQSLFKVEESFHVETGKLCGDLFKEMDSLGYNASQLKNHHLDSNDIGHHSERKHPPPPPAAPHTTTQSQQRPSTPSDAPPVHRRSAAQEVSPANTNNVEHTDTEDRRRSSTPSKSSGGGKEPSAPVQAPEESQSESKLKPHDGAKPASEKPQPSPRLYPKVTDADVNGDTGSNPFDDDEMDSAHIQRDSVQGVESKVKTVDEAPVAAGDGDGDGVTLYRVRATHTYAKEDADELAFEAGEIIRVIPYDDPEEQDEGWLMGIKDSSGEKGVFPANFTKRI